MGTSVVITGSGTPIPSADRAGPGVLVLADDLALQFDAGRSTVTRLTAAGVGLADLTALFATHHHSDHLIGLQDVVLTRWIMDRTDDSPPLPVVVPAGPAADFAGRLLDLWEADIEVRRHHSGRMTLPRYDVVEFDARTGPVEVWNEGDVRVIAGPVRHQPVEPAVGFRVETGDGVVAISGDTIVCDEVAALAQGADVLIYEAMRFEEIEQLPERRRFILDYHADTRLIGRQAAEIGVPVLVLTHLIPEPRDDADRSAYVEDIRGGGYRGDVIVADDLTTVAVGSRR